VTASQPAGPRVILAAICCQKGDWPANLAAHEEVLARARDEGCALAAFPEMSLTGSVDPVAHPGALLRLDSEPVRALAGLTRQYTVAAVFGVAERGDGGAHITQVYARDGRLAGAYRKRHLGEGEDAYTPGTGPAVFRLGRLSFGIAICAESHVDYPFDEPAGRAPRSSSCAPLPASTAGGPTTKAGGPGIPGGSPGASLTRAATPPGPEPGWR
jgi:predicted amidohydrolase